MNEISKENSITQTPDTCPPPFDIHTMTDQEIHDALVTSAQQMRPHDPDEIDQICRWAEQTLVKFTLLDLVVTGNATVQVLDGEVQFQMKKTTLRSGNPKQDR